MQSDDTSENKRTIKLQPGQNLETLLILLASHDSIESCDAKLWDRRPPKCILADCDSNLVAFVKPEWPPAILFRKAHDSVFFLGSLIDLPVLVTHFAPSRNTVSEKVRRLTARSLLAGIY